MNTSNERQDIPMGYKWRSSKWFTLATISIALYAETFLYGYLVPFLSKMLQYRLNVPPSKTQEMTSLVLGIYGALSTIAGPIIGHFSDQMPDRKISLLLSLGICIAGTCAVAGARSVPILLLGRAMQSVAGSAVWIIGFATVANAVSPNNMGSAMGLVMSFANSGTISGPAISGLLYDAVSYWVLWLIPLLVLAIDLVARVLLIEGQPEASSSKCHGQALDSNSPLLLQENQEASPSTGSLWYSLLCDGRILLCLLITFSSMTVSTSLHATLPLHIEEVFKWGTGSAGLLFAGITIPGIFLGPFAGWIRDMVGARYPFAIGSVLQALFLGFSGIAGNKNFSWASSHNGGKEIYAVSVIAFGTLRPFVSGIAPVELTVAAQALQRKIPGSLGEKDGVSRVIAMMDVAASLGMMVGPFVGGLLKTLFGYEYMSLTWSFLYLILAVFAICAF